MNWQRSTNKPLCPRVEWTPFDGHLVLVKDDRGIVVLNETARLMWEALAEGVTVAELVRGIGDRFGLPPDRARADVEAALAEWQARGLLGDASSARTSGPARSSTAPPPPANCAVECTYALCGHPVGFRFHDPDAENLIRPLLSPSEVIGPAAGEVIDLYRAGADHVLAANGAEIGWGPSAEEVLGLALGRVLEVSYPTPTGSPCFMLASLPTTATQSSSLARAAAARAR